MAEDKDPWGTKALGQALAMATNMAAALLVGYFSGYYLDKFFDTSPWLTITMFLLGMGAGIKMMYEAAFGRMGSKKADGEGDDGNKEKFQLKEGLAELKNAQQMLKDDRKRLLREKWVEEHREKNNDEDGTGPRS